MTIPKQTGSQMHPLHKVSIKTGSVNALNAQSHSSIYPTGFPFTLNPTMGCSFGCKFCYSPIFLRKNFAKENREHFFNESTIKLNIADSLNKELTRLSSLPQHLKRVQINETSDYYLAEVLKELENQGSDVMMEILETFQNHWIAGNKWMLHILTKSYLIEKHLDKLKEMKEMVQVEISFSTPYESQRRNLELYTPPIPRRLKTIDKLSKEGIFVRVMAMPFYGDVPELDELKRITFDAGAQALKNKALNYFEWNDIINISFEDLVQYKLPQTGSRKDTIISQAHMIKSGEDCLVSGIAETIDVIMPSDTAWDAMSKFQDRTNLQTLNKVEMGYDELNDVDWGYIKSKKLNFQSSKRINIMSNSDLSTAQKFYSSYFPEILKEPNDKKIYEVNSPFILNDVGKNLEIVNGGMFTCKKTNKTGFPNLFYQLVEGIPEHHSMDYFNLIKAGNFLPEMKDIQNYSNDLFNSNNSSVLDYLMNKHGLTDVTIKKYQIGYDEKNSRIVLPVLNATGCDVSAVKYISFPINRSSNKNLVTGLSRLLDYNQIYFNSKNIKRFLLVADVLDAIYLKQIGYDVLCNIDEDNNWYQEWDKLIKDKEIVILTNNVEEAIHWAKQIKRKAGSLKNISLSGGVYDFFIKDNKSSQEFEDVINTSKVFDEKFIKNYELIKTAKASSIKKNELNLAQDFVNDKMYFGIHINNELTIIRSGPERIDLEDLSAENLEPNHTEITESSFSIDGIEKYLLKNYMVDPLNVFNRIKDYLKKYMFISDKNVFDLLSIWIMGTYMFRVFRHYPYMHIQAEKSSGKSFLFELIKPLCFNGELYIHPTSSTLFRDVDSNSRTLLLDEIENFKKSKSPGFSDLMDILNSGYAKSGDVPRAKSGKKGGIVKYKTYSPKMFAGISDINDVLDSRTIKIQMKRKREEEKVDRYRDNQTMKEFYQSLDDDLYIFALQYAPQVNEKYSDENYSNFYSEKFDNRRSDIWTPLFIIAEVIESTSNLQSKTISEALFEYSKTEFKYHQVLDAESNELTKLVESLNIILKNIRYKKYEEINGEQILYYLTEDIYQAYLLLPENKRAHIKKTGFTQKLIKINIPSQVESIQGSTKSERCYRININELEDLAKRYGIEFTKEGILRIKSISQGQFIPQRLIITEKSKNAQRTAEIIDRVKKLNPDIEILNSIEEDPKRPENIGLTELYDYLKNTLVLATRTANFADCFPSPGNIVEGMTTTTNLGFQCSSNCEYCYLQDAGRQEIPWRKVYVNLETMEDEIQKEYLVFRFANALWCALSFYLEETLPKIPPGFKEIVNEFRNKVLAKNSIINSDVAVKNYLKDSLANHFLTLVGSIDNKKKLDAIKENVVTYYNENSKMKLWLTISEYYDLVRVNHITNNLDYLMNLISNNKEFRFSIYTKSAAIDNLLNYNGNNRVKFTIGFNTDEMITKYEHNTSSLDERFEAFNKLQKAKGYLLRAAIEPIIAYPGFEDDYKLLAQRMVKELDLGASNVEKIKFGCLRIGPQLQPRIEANHSNTKLFSDNQMLYPVVAPDTKFRYSEDVRLKIYEILLSEFGQFRPKLGLACEYPTIWKKLNLIYKDHMKSYIYQYPG